MLAIFAPCLQQSDLFQLILGGKSFGIREKRGVNASKIGSKHTTKGSGPTNNMISALLIRLRDKKSYKYGFVVRRFRVVLDCAEY